MLPPYECFDADNVAAAQVGDGLVIEAELAGAERERVEEPVVTISAGHASVSDGRGAADVNATLR